MDAHPHFADARIPRALFAEDFDIPASPPEPEVIEPVFTAAELAAAREAAWSDGHAAGTGEAAASDTAARSRALELIASQLHTAQDVARELVEQSAESIAGLLLAGLAASFPTLCRAYGEAEIRTVVRLVMPALTQEPAITVWLNPHQAPAIAQEINQLDPELVARIKLAESDSVPAGDVRITWRNGAAVRDGAALWDQIVAILAPAGLLRSNSRMMEMVDGQ